MVKNHCLAKSISDANWYLFREWIEYFAVKFDKVAIAVAPHYKFPPLPCVIQKFLFSTQTPENFQHQVQQLIELGKQIK